MINRGASRFDRLVNPVIVGVLWVLFGVSYLTRDYCAAASNLAGIGQRARNIEKARQALLRALEIAYTKSCHEELARGSVSMAWVLLTDRDYEGAQRVLGPQLKTIRTIGDDRLLVEALLKLGAIRDQAGDEPAAAQLWREAAEIALKTRYTFGYAGAVSNLGGVAYRAHRDSEAREYWLKAIDAASRHGDRLLVGKLDLYLGIIAMRMEDMEEAKVRFDASRANYEKVGRSDLASDARSYLDHLAQ